LEYDNAISPEPVEFMAAEVKAIHVPVNNVHAVVCALDVASFVDLDSKRFVLAMLDYLHETIDCGTGKELM
jgi:hypothetical protein